MKSALPDTALEPSWESLVHHTAPLWPRKVPIQSPVHSLSMGLPSLQLETSKYVLSSRIGEKERWVTGRVWPGATRGTAFGWEVISRKEERCEVVVLVFLGVQLLKHLYVVAHEQAP